MEQRTSNVLWNKRETWVLTIAGLVGFGFGFGCWGCYYWLTTRTRTTEEELETTLEKWKALRHEERKGRIRAEKELQTRATQQQIEQGYSLQPIGVFRTPFRDRRGTPRQGLFCPHVQGQLIFHPSIGPEAVEGLEEFSHIWILFTFHKNTGSKLTKNDKGGFNFKAKIAAPGLSGDTTGAFASRTPHRANNIGLSLVELKSVEQKKISDEEIEYGLEPSGVSNARRQDKKYRRRTNRIVLHCASLDLVDGTPVFDIKPFVPQYDSPEGRDTSLDFCRVPRWICETADQKLPVIMPEAVSEKICHLHSQVSRGSWSCHSSSDGMLHGLKDILALDIRSVHRGRAVGSALHEQAVSCRDRYDDVFEVWYDNVHVAWTFNKENNSVHVIDAG